MFKIFKSKENRNGNEIKFEDIPVNYGEQAQNVNEISHLHDDWVYEEDNVQYQPEGKFVNDFQTGATIQDEDFGGKKKIPIIHLQRAKKHWNLPKKSALKL